MPIKADIKICGLRREIDADYINEFEKIKYAGFVFYDKSRRNMEPLEVSKIKKRLREDIKAVGVFAEKSAEEVIELAKAAELDVIQLHSEETKEDILKIKKELNLPIWKSIAVKDKESLEKAEELADVVDGFILDAFCGKERGGSGKSFNWDLAKDFSKKHFMALAGGISEDNILLAEESVKPDIIDLSSSVETDGYKDYEKIKSLIRRIN